MHLFSESIVRLHPGNWALFVSFFESSFPVHPYVRTLAIQEDRGEYYGEPIWAQGDALPYLKNLPSVTHLILDHGHTPHCVDLGKIHPSLTHLYLFGLAFDTDREFLTIISGIPTLEVLGVQDGIILHGEEYAGSPTQYGEDGACTDREPPATLRSIQSDASLRNILMIWLDREWIPNNVQELIFLSIALGEEEDVESLLTYLGSQLRQFTLSIALDANGIFSESDPDLFHYWEGLSFSDQLQSLHIKDIVIGGGYRRGLRLHWVSALVSEIKSDVFEEICFTLWMAGLDDLGAINWASIDRHLERIRSLK